MKVDVSSWEMHNVVKRGKDLRTRRALLSLKTPTGGTSYVGGFTQESPNTSEPWHHLFEQAADGTVTMRVYNEEMAVEIFSHPLGVMQKDPVISYGVQNMQMMINSPSFSAPLYALLGGGAVTAMKTVTSIATALSETVLSVPVGHICTFGDRFAIAQGKGVFINDPGLDPRTFTGDGSFPIAGAIYDIFQGEDGFLYMCTSSGIFTFPRDALGQGLSPQGALSRIPNVDTSRPRNAIAAGGGGAVLQKDRVLLLGGGGVAGAIDLSQYDGRRYWSKVVAVDDLRMQGELFATPTGFLVGFRGSRGHIVDVNLNEKAVRYIWSPSSAFNLVGTLRTRNNDPLMIFSDRIVSESAHALADYDGATIQGVLCGRLPIDVSLNPRIYRVVVAAANQGSTVGAFVSGLAKTTTTPTKTEEAVIGTSLWSASTVYAGRETRSARLSFSQRSSDPNMEIRVDAGDSRIRAEIDVELGGQGAQRDDRP